MARENKPNKVYDELKRKIMYLEMKPGEALGEVEIAQQFGVSRTPVRDAFKKLESDGLIEVKSHIGTYVTLIDLEQISDAIFIREQLEKAIIIELCSNRKISVNMRLNYLLSAQDKIINGGLEGDKLAQKFMEIDNEFHKALFDLAGKESIWNYIENLEYHYNRLRIYVNQSEKTKLRKIHEQHKQIISAIEKQDEQLALAIYEQHLYEQMLLGADEIIEGHMFFKGLRKE